jgi:uncharacterized membrane protein YsdA (DUF1294 family)
MAARLAAAGTVFYLGVVNVGAFGLFGYDKFQAANGGWRVRETDLCKSALFGGWLGGMVAMQAFRHKTLKTSFQEKYVAATAKSAATGGIILAIACRNAVFRSSLIGSARSALLLASDIVGKSGGNIRGKLRDRRDPRRR